MNFFDRLYLSVFHQVKQYNPKLAARWARFYVSIFQLTLCLLFGIFFMKFSKQMKLNILDNASLKIVSLGIIVFIFFKIGWVTTEKKETFWSQGIQKEQNHTLYILWLYLYLLYLPCLLFFLKLYKKTPTNCGGF